jgi:hypothetical protein
MVTESTRADIEAGSETYFVRGSVVVDPGYAGIYTYARSSDEEIPKLEEGQPLEFDGDPWIIDKETQPPGRISQAKLIEMMEERGLGTKATRADIIQKLFDRGYVYNNPPIPTETGIALYEAFKSYVPEMATPEMTAQLEAEMDRIAAGEMTKGAVVGESRELLHKTWSEIEQSREDLAKVIWKGMDEDRILGPCKVCEEAGRTKEDGSPNMLRIIRAKKSGKRFVGCSGWVLDDPESCDQTFPLPQRGDVFKLEERCSICDQTPRLKVQPFRGSVAERDHLPHPEPAGSALVGDAGVGEAVGDDHAARLEGRADDPGGEVGPRGEEEQQLGQRVELDPSVGQQLPDPLRRLRSARLPDQQRVGPEGIGEQAGLRALTRPIDALERDEQGQRVSPWRPLWRVCGGAWRCRPLPPRHRSRRATAALPSPPWRPLPLRARPAVSSSPASTRNRR